MNWVAFFQIAIGVPVMIAGAMGFFVAVIWLDARLKQPWGAVLVGGLAILALATLVGLTSP